MWLGLYILVAGDCRPVEQQKEKGAKQAGQTSWRRTDRITDSRMAVPPRSYRYRCRHRARCAMEVGVCFPGRLVETANYGQRKIRGSLGMCHLSRAGECSMARFASSTGDATGIKFHGPG